MVESLAFPTIHSRIEKILPITNQYNYHDLVKAIFCFNICINNRGILESCLALNASVCEYEQKGNLEIKSYADFIEFLQAVKPFLEPQLADDPVVEDFGDVKLHFDGKYYSVVLGTGHSSVYGCYNFLESLAEEMKLKNEYREMLEYSSEMIDYFKPANKPDGLFGARFCIPDEELFQSVGLYFDENLKNHNLVSISANIQGADTPIEKLHFYSDGDNIVPLYNTSILVDWYDRMYSKLADEQKVIVANRGITKRAWLLFDCDREKMCSAYLPGIIFEDGKPNKNEKIFPLILSGRKGIIIFMNIDEYSEDELIMRTEQINKLHKEKGLQFGEAYDRFSSGYLRAAQINSNVELAFLYYTSMTNINENGMVGHAAGDIHVVTALDVIYYLNFMDDADELFDYLTYTNKNEYNSMFAFGTDAPRFLAWKQEEHMFAKGAMTYDYIDLGYDSENVYVVDYFKNNLSDYPFHLDDYIFQEPFAWRINNSPHQKMKEFVGKYGVGFGGKYQLLDNGAYIFLSHNVKFYNNDIYAENQEIIYILDELVEEMVDSCKFHLSQITELNNSGIQIMYMPEEYARKAGGDHFFNDASRQYIYSEAIYYRSKWIVRYTVKNIDYLLESISKASNRSIEVQIFKEILLPITQRIPRLDEELQEVLPKISNDKKMVDVTAMEIDYVWNKAASQYSVSNHAFHVARKRIAQICIKNEIQPGEYKGKSATQVIRKMQREITLDYESLISLYDMKEMHCCVLDIYASLQHEINVNWKRYGSYTDLDFRKENEVRQNIIHQREEAKKNSRNVLYLLETNLCTSRTATRHITQSELEVLLAYSNWMVVINDVADMCHYTEMEAHVEITSEYLVDTISEENYASNHVDIAERIYKYSYGLQRDGEIDKKYMGLSIDAFKQDTGIEFSHLYDLFYYFKNSFTQANVYDGCANVYLIKKEDMVRDFVAQMAGTISEVDVDKLLSFVIINPIMLKNVKGVADFYLPIGRRNDRNNRLEVQPLVQIGETIIFSPPAIENLEKIWINGIHDFMLPYEVGMDNTITILKQWKHEYEKKIVQDIATEFERNGFFHIKCDLEPRKIKTIRNMPKQSIGDYDVFAIDTEHKSIWIVECKVIEKVATFYEMYHQQYNFFVNHRFAEKFQRRIDFMREHLHEILEWVGIDMESEYSVVPYMCMNKVLIPRYVDVSFPIVSYPELCEAMSKHSFFSEKKLLSAKQQK